MGQSMKIVASGHVTGDGWYFYKDLCEPSTLSFSSPYNTKKSKKHERFSGQQDVSQISRLFFGKPLFLVTLFFISLVTPVTNFALNRFAKYAWNITFPGSEMNKRHSYCWIYTWSTVYRITYLREPKHGWDCQRSSWICGLKMQVSNRRNLLWRFQESRPNWWCSRVLYVSMRRNKHPMDCLDIHRKKCSPSPRLRWIWKCFFSYTPLKSDVGSSTKAAWCHWPQWGMPQRVPHTSWGATILLSRERCWDIFG